jgi:hypothetical protein
MGVLLLTWLLAELQAPGQSGFEWGGYVRELEELGIYPLDWGDTHEHRTGTHY